MDTAVNELLGKINWLVDKVDALEYSLTELQRQYNVLASRMWQLELRPTQIYSYNIPDAPDNWTSWQISTNVPTVTTYATACRSAASEVRQAQIEMMHGAAMRDALYREPLGMDELTLVTENNDEIRLSQV